ncbi:hypothetical protein ACJ5N2_11655 [Aeromonas salmonicida]|uniref:hypothetical protein n=1 Tax=Aeromonas salmonicida TaxID=645 RepID=UPI0038B87E11
MKNEVHTAAKNALKGGVMDAEIYDADIIEAFGSQNKSIERYLDLHIRDLIALRPRDFYDPGSSWRNAAQKLHCQGWDQFRDEIVRYFTSDLKDHPFPAPNSHQEFRIGFTGGAIYCKLGNHRAVAAKAWLASNHGENAIFKKTKYYYRNICPPLKGLMRECINEGYILKHAFVAYENRLIREHDIYNLILVERNASSCDLYSLDTRLDRLELIEPSKNPILRVTRSDLRSKCLRLDFKIIPPKLIQIMLNDSKAIEAFGFTHI